jgi:hypothetical protein
MINVSAFGAVGDGVTDDTAAFQNALNTGDAVYAPKKTYLIAGSLTFPTSGQTLYGDGKDETVLIKNSACEDFIVIPAGVDPLNHVEIKDLSFDNQMEPTSGTAIKVLSGNVTLQNIRIARSYNALEVSGNGVLLEKLWVENYNANGLWVHDCNDVFLSNFIFNAEFLRGAAPNAIGIKLTDRVEAFIASSGDILGGSHSLWTGAASYTTGLRPAYNRFRDVYFDSSDNGVWLDRTVLNKFTGCWFSARPGNGLFIGNCNDSHFIGCEFANCGAHGALVDVLAKRSVFTTCSFVGNSVNSPNVYHGLAIAANTTDFTVQNCTATNGLVGGSQGWGIIVNAGSSNRYTIAFNLIGGNGVGGVSDAGSGAQKAVGSNF